MWSHGLLLGGLIVVVVGQSVCNISQAEYDALEALYKSCNGNYWLWDPLHPEKKWIFPSGLNIPCFYGWQGLTCLSVAADECSITEIDLSDTNLVGPLPVEIGNFADLNSLNLEMNSISGTFPNSLYSLTALEELILADNSFHDSLSTDISALANIVEIDLSSNYLMGPIPNNIGSLRKLKLLNLANTHLFHGSIPQSLSSCVKLEVLYLYESGLTGPLPLEMSNFSRLEYVALYGNYLNGTISSTFTKLPSLLSLQVNTNYFSGANLLSLGVGPLMYYLDASYNKFSGPLPTDWTVFVQLQFILYDYNYMSQTIPDSIGRPTNVVNYTYINNTNDDDYDVIHVTSIVKSFIQFSVANNELIGTIPSSLATHVNMTLLSLASNRLSGTISSEFSSMHSLATFNVSNNNLKGNLIGMFGAERALVCPNLTFVSIANNSFDGSIPPALFMSSLLEVISLSTNCFTGDLPDTICYSSVLQSVVMNAVSSGSGCKVQFPHLLSKLFKGNFSTKRLNKASIPSCLWNISSLQTLHMAGNGLKGPIPDLPLHARLTNVQLGSNALTGTIPLYIQQSGQFISLGLQHNKLTGTLIDDFAVNVSMQLDLSVNRLSGRVPWAFHSVSNLNVLTGNVFQCVSNSDLPQNDQSSKNYVCGSSNYDLALYLWGVVMGANLLLCLMGLSYLYYDSNYGSKSGGTLPRSVSSSPDGHRLRSKANISIWAGWKAFILRVFLNTLQWYQFKYESGRDKFPNTFQFLTMMTRASWGIRQIALVYIFVCMIIYLIMKCSVPSSSAGAISTVYPQYGWTTTSSYMHGSAPVTVILVFLFASLCFVSIRIRSKDRDHIVTPDRFSFKSDDMSSSDTGSSSPRSVASAESIKGKYSVLVHFWLKKLVVPALIQLLNIFVTTTANVLYVESIELQLVTLTPVQQIMTEMCMASFKLAWGATYIPWTLQFLDELSVAHRLSHLVFMFCFLIIGAPLIASAVGSQDCFLNVFVPYSPIQSSYTNVVTARDCQQSVSFGETANGTSYSQLHSDCSFVDSSGSVSEDTVAPFIYSYQCGSTILANYIPVLVYSYVFSSVVLPMIRIIMLHSPQSVIKSFLPVIIYRGLVANTLLDCDDVLFMAPTELSENVRNASSDGNNTTPKTLSGSSRAGVVEISSGFAASDGAGSAVSSLRGSDASMIANSISTHSPEYSARSSGSRMDLMYVTGPQAAVEVGGAADIRQSGNLEAELSSKSLIRLPNRLFVFTTRHFDEDGKTRPLFDGSTIVAKKLLDFAVMISFGLAAPILGLVIAFSVIVNAGIWKIMIGKYLTFYAAGNTIARDRLELSSIGLLDAGKSGMWVVTFVVISFWCLMIYDMTADVFGLLVGSLLTTSVFVLMPILLLAVVRIFDRYDSDSLPVPRAGRVQSARLSLANIFAAREQAGTAGGRSVANPIVTARDAAVNSSFATYDADL
jgi:hypothetical protein